MNTCRKCNASVPEEQAFCQNCGAAMMTVAHSTNREDDSWNMAATIVNPNFRLPTSPPKPTPPPAASAVPAHPPQPSPAASPATVPPPAPTAPREARPVVAAAKNRTSLYIGIGIGVVLVLFGILALLIVLILMSQR